MKPSSTDTQQVERDIATTTTSEQAADLAALAAAANDGAPGAPATLAEQEPPRRDLAAEITGLVTAAVAALGPMFPSLKTIYTPETTQAAAGSIAAVCDKHGWLADGLGGKWGEEIACAFIVGPLAFATYQGVRADLAARAPAKAPERLDGPNLAAQAPTEVPGSKTVTFGGAAPVEAAA